MSTVTYRDAEAPLQVVVHAANGGLLAQQAHANGGAACGTCQRRRHHLRLQRPHAQSGAGSRRSALQILPCMLDKICMAMRDASRVWLRSLYAVLPLNPQ